MHRNLEHHAFVNRSYDELCAILDGRGPELIRAATVDAEQFAADLAGYLEQQLGFFDSEERLHAVAGPLEVRERQATMSLTWEADRTKRFLPNVDATIQVTPIISKGPSATSEIRLRGTYTPPRSRHHSLMEQALSRRLVDATLHTFLRRLADSLRTERSTPT